MSLSSPTPPAPVPAGQVAQQQQTYNTQAGIESQAGSAVDQQNPYASLTYTQTGTGPGGVPLYTATTQLSPAQQQLLNTLQGTQQTAGSAASNILAGANYGGTNPATAIGNETSGLTGQQMSQYATLMNPIMQPQVTQLDTQLRNQGFDPSSPAYKQAMNNLLQSQYQQEQGFAAQVEPAAFSQATQLYNLPLQTAGSLASLGQPNTGAANTWANAPALNVQPANYTGAVAQQENISEQQYQQQLAQQQAMMTGLFGLGSSALGGMTMGTGLGGALSSGLKSLGNTIGNAIIPGNWGGSY